MRLRFPYRLIFLLVIVAFFCEIYGYYLGIVLGTNNWWLFNCYNFVEILCMGGAGVGFARDKRLKALFAAGVVLCSAIGFIEFLKRPLTEPATVTMVCYSTLLTLIYLTILFANSLFSSKSVLMQPVFWICLSSIVYFSCSIPFLGLSSYLFKFYPSLASSLLMIITILNVIRYPMIGVAFYLQGQSQRNHPPADLKSALQ